MSDLRGGSAPRPSPLPSVVWVLGWVSLLMDISSEMIHSLLPLFMVGSLGASPATVGLIEGMAESTALVVKMFSGVLSDVLGRRKVLALVGYGLAALTKPLFAWAPNLGWLLTARLLDRVGKGVRGAPRDALIADVVPPQRRAEAFGLRQSLDTAGAFVGPLVASGLLWWGASNLRGVFWVAVVPAGLAVMLLAFGVREPASASPAQSQRVLPWQREHLRRLERPYWRVVALGAVFGLARFSDAFLVLRTRQFGVPIAAVPLIMVAMNVVYAVSAYPLGKLADRISHTRLLALGLVVLIAADLLLGHLRGLVGLLAGMGLWGVHLGMTQGLLAAMVADTAPAPLRGTAFGLFNLASGVALMLASALAGVLWTTWGSALTFDAGAVFSGLSLLLLMRPVQGSGKETVRGAC